MESRLANVEQRLDRVEDRQEKLEHEHQKHREEFAETKVYVKEIYKKLEAVNVSLELLKTTSGNKWEQLWSKVAWFALGILGTIVSTKLK